MSEVLVLFAGAADGWGVGLQRAGHRIVACAESEPDRRAALRHHHPHAVIYDDVRTVTRARLLADLGRLPAVVVGSPPCQDISCANNGRAQGVDGARSGLYFEFVRIVGEVRPDWYAAENAAQLKTRGFERIETALDAVGYTCWPSVVGAREVGYFHLRKRSWLAGVDARHTQGEPMGTAGQPWQATPDAADTNLSEPGRRPAMARRENGPRHAEGLPKPNGIGADTCCLGVRQLHQQANRRAKADLERRGEGAAANPPGVRQPGLDGPDPGRRETEAGAGLPDYLAAIERAARAVGLGGRTRLAEHYRMADGVRSGLARLCISAYGDALVPDIAEVFGQVMPQLLAELRGDQAAA